MSSVTAVLTYPEENLMEITAGHGPIFLMDYFFNNKQGRVSNFFAYSENSIYSSSENFMQSQAPLVLFGQPAIKIQFNFGVKQADFREGNTLLVPADDTTDGWGTVEVICAESDYFHTEGLIRFKIELWMFAIFMDGRCMRQGWMIEPMMANPKLWATYNTVIHRLEIS